MSFSKVAKASLSEEVTHFLTLKEIRQPVNPEAQEEFNREKQLQERLAQLEREIQAKELELKEAEAAFRSSLEAERERFNQELTQEKENVLKAAFSDGFNKGNQEGLNAWTEKLNQATITLEKAIEDAHTYLNQSEWTILKLALVIAEKIVGERLEEKASWQSLVQQATREMRETSPIKILVAPERVNMTREALDTLREMTYGAEIFVFSDPDLNSADCIVESPSGRLDASVTTQMNRLKKALSERLGSPL